MGKKARIKKEAKIQQILETKKQIIERKNAVRAPVVRTVKRVIAATIITVAILYVGQVINQRIAKAQNISEIIK